MDPNTDKTLLKFCKLPSRSQFACFKMASDTTGYKITSPVLTCQSHPQALDKRKIVILQPLVPIRVKEGNFKIVSSPKVSKGPLKAVDLDILHSSRKSEGHVP